MIRLKDKLSHLTYTQACKFLGPKGAKLIREGGGYDIDLAEQVTLTRDLCRLHLGRAVVTMRMDPLKRQRLHYECSACETACTHLGAAFSLILEEKLALGLASPPPEKTLVEGLSDEEFVKQAMEERAERAQTEKMRLKSFDANRLWTDYAVTNRSSGKTYRVALRGWERGESFCTYQLDGIAFAVGTGRSIIADDMGLGKTIQGIGVAELLAQDADISKVLIICPRRPGKIFGTDAEHRRII